DRAGAVVETRDAAAGRMAHSNARAFDLARARFATQLSYDLDDLCGTGSTDGVALGQQAARGVDRNLAADTGSAALQQSDAFAGRAETERLVIQELRNRKRVMHFRDVDIAGSKPRFPERFMRTAHGDLGRGHVTESRHETPRGQM